MAQKRARRKGKKRRGANHRAQRRGPLKTRRNTGPAEASDHGWSFESSFVDASRNLPREFVLGRDMRELPNIAEVSQEEEVARLSLASTVVLARGLERVARRREYLDREG